MTVTIRGRAKVVVLPQSRGRSGIVQNLHILIILLALTSGLSEPLIELL